MGGGISAGGLITGIDSGALIRQLMQLERQPILRLQSRIQDLEAQQEAISELRSTLQTLRNAVQDFRFADVFDSFQAQAADTDVLTAQVSGSNPAVGSFTIDVQQLATATVATSNGRIGAAINPAATLDASGINTAITAGVFTINGVAFNVDPATQTLNDILGAINGSGAGITATYDAVSDTVTIENSAPGDTSIVNFGAGDDTSNFLDAIGVDGAYQFTNGNGSTELVSLRPLGTVSTANTLNTVNFGGGALTAGSFNINGVSITVDPSTDTLGQLIVRINSSDAGVTASLDTFSDSIRIVADDPGSRTISFVSGSSNFLDLTNLTTAIQTAGSDAQFTVNGGPVMTENSNTVTGAISGVTLDLLSIGTTAVTISQDNDAIVEEVRGFVEAFNAAVQQVAELTGEDGALKGDYTIRTTQSFLRSTVFSAISGLGGDFNSLLNVGFSSGDSFDSSAPFQLSFDETEFMNALQEDAGNVSSLFTNDAETGVFDTFFTYLDEITATSGFLNQRSRAGGSLDNRVDLLNDQIERIERRISMRELRLRTQFANLEITVNSLKTQGSALFGLSVGLGGF